MRQREAEETEAGEGLFSIRKEEWETGTIWSDCECQAVVVRQHQAVLINFLPTRKQRKEARSSG